jgi:hypothetical protein
VSNELVQLRILGLSNTDVTDEGLAPLKGFLRLEELDLRGTTVRELGAQELRRKSVACRNDNGPKAAPSEEPIRAIIRDRLRRRLSAPKRIGCPYRLAEL